MLCEERDKARRGVGWCDVSQIPGRFAAPESGRMQGGATQAMRGSSSRSANAADGFSPVQQMIRDS
jgi:hypothetical protein